ncbi:hypothetical protein F5887DRAFT_117996 [Amanita rubescens]|nr:hypothetical protein F5887DRAFT_117996 [Amanita rubescens]
MSFLAWHELNCPEIHHLYDFFQTIELEVECIWNARFDFVKLIYLFTKYLPFIDVPLLACGWFGLPGGADWTQEQCRILDLCISGSFIVGSASSQGILALRTWGLWGRPRWMIYVLASIAIAMTIFGAINSYSALNSVEFDTDHDDGFSGGRCTAIIDIEDSILWISWAFQLIYDGLLCTLLIINAVVELKKGRISRPIYIIYRDGVMFHVYLFLLMFMFLLFLLGIHQQFLFPVTILNRVVHPLFAVRVVLHVRRYAQYNALPESNMISTIWSDM